MKKRSVPSLQEQEDFLAMLKAKPGLAQSYIEVAQQEYDKQVKSGKLTPEQAREAKKLMKQFHGEMTGFIVRAALAKVARRLLKMQKKARLNQRDADDLIKCMDEITLVDRQLKAVPKVEREELAHFMDSTVMETSLQFERVVVQIHGKANARVLFECQLPSEIFGKSKPAKGKTPAARPAARRTSALPGSLGRKPALKTSRRV